MSAAKHTPGPWSFQSSAAHGYRIRTSASTSSKQWGSGDVAVVFFAGNGRSAEQCKADARLIAAAPELVEALRDARGYIQANRDCLADSHRNPASGELHPVDVCAEDDKLLARVDAAIAKATGEQS